MVFGSGMCQLGIGALKSRDDPMVYNSDKEKLLFQHTTENDFYKHFGNKCLKNRITLDLYLGVPSASESIDLASMNYAVQLTGGDLVYFSKFNVDKHGEKLYYELFRNLTKQVGTEVTVKARCSEGFSVTEYFGSFGLKEAVDFQLSSIDADKTFCFQLRNDRTITEDSTVYVQVAMLYTTLYGERRIRVFNTAY
jgi:protein transport protein SEC24